MSNQVLRCLFGLLMVLPAVGWASGFAEEEYYRNIRVNQPKPILLKQRVEVTPWGGYCLNPNMLHRMGVGGRVGYHINESFAITAQYTHFFSFHTTTREEVRDYFGLFPERSEIGYTTTLRFAWTPFLAKARTFGALTYWDAYLFAGGGVSQTRLSSIAGTGEFGLGLRYYLTRGLAFVMEFSDLMIYETFRNESALLHDFTVRLGLSLFIPYSFTYRSER